MNTEFILKQMQALGVYHSLVCKYGEYVVTLTNFSVSIEVSISVPHEGSLAYQIRDAYVGQLGMFVGTEIIFDDHIMHDILLFKWNKPTTHV